MKKTILTLAGMLMIGLAVNAQTDSTLTPGAPEQNVPQTQPTQSQTTTTQTQQTTQYRTENRVRVPASEIPASMRKSLKNSQYTGWEKSTIYRDKTTNDYYFDVQNGATSRTYRFDKSGNAINENGSLNQTDKNNSINNNNTKPVQRNTEGSSTTPSNGSPVK